MRGGQSLSLCVPCAAVDVAQMPDAPPRGGRGKFTSQLVESYIFELFDRNSTGSGSRPGPARARSRVAAAGPARGAWPACPAAVNGGTVLRAAPLGRSVGSRRSPPDGRSASRLEGSRLQRLARRALGGRAGGAGRRCPVPGPFGLPAGHSTADRSRLSWSGPPTRTPPPKLYTLLATAIHAFTIHSEADRTRGVQL